MTETSFVLSKSLGEDSRDAAAALYVEAFGQKFLPAIPDKNQVLEVVRSGLRMEFSIGVFHQDHLVGIAGYSTPKGTFTAGINTRLLWQRLGFFGCVRALLVLSLYERNSTPRELLMDGICVHSDYRGKGVGTTLLDSIKDLAYEGGFSTIRLDVIETNPRAKKLYLRHGFQSKGVQRFKFLKPWLGFESATTMVYTL